MTSAESQDAAELEAHRRGLADSAATLCYFGDVFTRVHGPHPAGHVHDGHEHQFDHQTLLVSGSVRIIARRNGEVMGDKVFRAPRAIVIRADTWHEITALEDATVWVCAFAVRDLGDPLVHEGCDPYG